MNDGEDTVPGRVPQHRPTQHSSDPDGGVKWDVQLTCFPMLDRGVRDRL